MAHVLTVASFAVMSFLNMAWSGILIAWLREPKRCEMLQNALGQSARYFTDVVSPVIVSASLSLSVTLAISFLGAAWMIARHADDESSGKLA